MVITKGSCTLEEILLSGIEYDKSGFVQNNSCQGMIDHARIAARQAADNIGRHSVQSKIDGAKFKSIK